MRRLTLAVVPVAVVVRLAPPAPAFGAGLPALGGAGLVVVALVVAPGLFRPATVAYVRLAVVAVVLALVPAFGCAGVVVVLVPVLPLVVVLVVLVVVLSVPVPALAVLEPALGLAGVALPFRWSVSFLASSPWVPAAPSFAALHSAWTYL
jgi:hypothetical protein